MNREDLEKKEKELKIFKNINGTNKAFRVDHTNYIKSDALYAANQNQGIARAKLRKFVSEKEVDYEYWSR